MSCIDDRIIHPQISVCKYRISRTSFKPFKKLRASCYRYTVLRSGAALCMHQIIISVYLVDMWSFRPYAALYSAFPYGHAPALKLHGSKIKLLYPYLPVSIVAYSFRVWACATVITSAVIIEEKAWVYSDCFFSQIIRIRPRSCRILRCHYKIAAMRYIGRYHIKSSFMISYGRCKNTSRYFFIFHA